MHVSSKFLCSSYQTTVEVRSEILFYMYSITPAPRFSSSLPSSSIGKSLCLSQMQDNFLPTMLPTSLCSCGAVCKRQVDGSGLHLENFQHRPWLTPFQRGYWGWGESIHQKYAAGLADGIKTMVGFLTLSIIHVDHP
jgi:hypothetical protein